MKRSPMLRRTPLKAKTPLARTSRLLTTKPLARVSTLRRTRLVSRIKVRTAEQGADPEFKAFVQQQPCCACGALPPSHAHHETLGGRGKSQKAHDRRSLPFCFKDHDDFHLIRGRFKGWSREQRKAFQELEIERLQAIWDGIQDHGTAQEPMRLAI